MNKTKILIIYIDDVLLFSSSIEEHLKHLNKLIQTVKENSLHISTSKMNLFQTKIKFLAHHIQKGTITPIQRSIQFVDKFSNEIKDKQQLQLFLRSLNYVSNFIKDLSQICAPLSQRLKKDPLPQNEDHTKIVKFIKTKVKTLSCLNLVGFITFNIVEIDTPKICNEWIFKQTMVTKKDQ